MLTDDAITAFRELLDGVQPWEDPPLACAHLHPDDHGRFLREWEDEFGEGCPVELHSTATAPPTPRQTASGKRSRDPLRAVNPDADLVLVDPRSEWAGIWRDVMRGRAPVLYVDVNPPTAA